MNNLTSEQLYIGGSSKDETTFTAFASDLGWPVGYRPKAIKIDGVFYRLTETNASVWTYEALNGRKAVILND